MAVVPAEPDLLSGEAAGGSWIAGLTVQYDSISAEAKGAGGENLHAQRHTNFINADRSGTLFLALAHF